MLKVKGNLKRQKDFTKQFDLDERWEELDENGEIKSHLRVIKNPKFKNNQLKATYKYKFLNELQKLTVVGTQQEIEERFNVKF